LKRLHIFQRRISGWLGLVLAISLLGPVSSPFNLAPEAQAAALPACSAAAAAQSNIRVTPSHGNAFYIDSGQGQNIDASYVGYQVHVENAAAVKSGLWISLENFNGGSVSLANPLDGQQVLRTFAGSDTQTAFFLLKATKPTTAAQKHTVRIYKAPPNIATANDVVYECQYSFSRVRETIKASANKVTEVRVDAVPRLGETFTVTVTGATGTVGAGGSPDFDSMWLSPAPRSTFPTRAMKLVSTRIVYSVQGANNVPANLTTFSNQLLINNLTAKLNDIKNGSKRATYVATYTF
jgi:hypothetical protein